jgi:hypothetical protein
MAKEHGAVHERTARAILREVPIVYLDRFVRGFGKLGPRANGDACGNGCGNNCTDGVGLVFDRYGQSGLTAEDIESAQKDTEGLQASLRSEVSRILR